ncbi:hypothetical protein [Nonomuraea sp. NPDC001023]|uniref:hypothetical protein n=1 Tax=unclassified Nonomuraea TaxID=2593643 RepID=UPI0033171B5A
MVPVAAALVVLGPQLTTALFSHGNASAAAARALYALAARLLRIAEFRILAAVLRGPVRP